MYQLEKQQLQVIINYLGKRPYAEVAGLIDMLTRLPIEKKANVSENKDNITNEEGSS